MENAAYRVKETKDQREIWVDNVKAIACILVVLGHFFQSLTKADILPTNDLYQWFEQTIYYVHIGFSQQQPKRQQRGPAWRRAGRVCVCG